MHGIVGWACMVLQYIELISFSASSLLVEELEIHVGN